jgi:hypothetical protein
MNRTGKGNVPRSFAREGHKVHFRVLTPRSQFTSPRLEARQDALESLWDGFERLKPRNTEARGENPGFDEAKA